MTKIHLSKTPECPICESKSTPLYYAGEHHMFKCGKCFLAFVFPMPTDEFLSKFYSQFHKNFGDGGGYELWEDRTNADFPAKVAKVKSVIAINQARILDIGCGKGYFVKACVENGLKAEGIDLSNTAIEFAQNTLGVNAICGKIEDHPELEGLYDVVTFWATIEHLNDPIKTLTAIKKVLKPGGRIILDTGIGSDWLDKLLPGFVQWYDPPQHLFVFSEKSIVQALIKAGFHIENIDSCYERSRVRRIVRILRGFIYAASLRFVSEITRTKGTIPFNFTRFPIGNLISVIARVDK